MRNNGRDTIQPRRSPDPARLWGRIQRVAPLCILGAVLLTVPLARAQSLDLCQALAARFAAAPDRLAPESLVGLTSCVTAELAARIGPPGEALPDGEAASLGGEQRQAVAPAPRPVPPNVFPSVPVPSPSMSAQVFPDQATGPISPSSPQQYLGQWPAAARWGSWPDGSWGGAPGM
ncbi:MAG TPA: hypothetical protein VMD08_11615 [Candidatus Baltobacteraceae bacterium]|nr:hypothetical protein [Candidatus Baltobacteraceae bacterium]